MPLQLDKDIDLSPQINHIYVISSQHRQFVNDSKSRWIISMREEVNCFINAHISNWVDLPLAWGVIKNNGSLTILGESKLNKTLKLAKFTSYQNKWHGYPADYVRNQQDRPNTNTLLEWRKQGIIEKHQIVKIRKGVECNL